MGGRGASSGGGGGSLKALASRENELKTKLAEYSQYALPSYDGSDRQKMAAKYYKYKEQLDAVREKRNRLLDAQAAKKSVTGSQPKKTFVNSFGEATKREITNTSYQNATRRMNRQIMSFVGGKTS